MMSDLPLPRRPVVRDVVAPQVDLGPNPLALEQLLAPKDREGRRRPEQEEAKTKLLQVEKRNHCGQRQNELRHGFGDALELRIQFGNDGTQRRWLLVKDGKLVGKMSLQQWQAVLDVNGWA